MHCRTHYGRVTIACSHNEFRFVDETAVKLSRAVYCYPVTLEPWHAPSCAVLRARESFSLVSEWRSAFYNMFYDQSTSASTTFVYSLTDA